MRNKWALKMFYFFFLSYFANDTNTLLYNFIIISYLNLNVYSVVFIIL